MSSESASVIDGAADVAEVFWRVAGPLKPKSFLDVGTGLNGVVGLHYWDRLPGRRVALDICEVKKLPREWETLIADGRDIGKLFGRHAFDVVQSCCCLEHLTKEDGVRFLRDATRVARRAVLIFTPLGFQPSPAADRDPHNQYQQHLSGWTCEELEARGFTAVLWGGVSILAWHVH
jgi:hypothetical protein